MTPADDAAQRLGVRRLTRAPRYLLDAFRLVYATDRKLASFLIGFAVLSGVLPGGMAFAGRYLIDAIAQGATHASSASRVGFWIGVEFGLGFLLVLVQRGSAVNGGVLRLALSQRVSELALEKALTLPFSDFEDPHVADQLTRIREQARERPLSLVERALAAVKESVELAAFSCLLAGFSLWLPLGLVLAALPLFVAEVRFNAGAFQLFRRHSAELRKKAYFEEILLRPEYAKEVQLFATGRAFLERQRASFASIFAAERRLALRRGALGMLLSVITLLALGAGYIWVTWSALHQHVSVGRAAMLYVALKQVQTSATALLLMLAGMHEDHLYLSTLHDFLARPAQPERGGAREGTRPGDGFRLEHVSFGYPGADQLCLRDVNLHIPSGTRLSIVGRNGAGKSTLVRLLLGLYAPSEGRILFDGVALAAWNPTAFRARISAIFQDFVRYQLLAGENIGAGAANTLADELAWQRAAKHARADTLIEALPNAYATQLGRTFPGGVELSLGEWQRVALARLLVRRDADVLVFDEPSSSLDPLTEAALLNELAAVGAGRTQITVSHRVSTAKRADRIILLEGGRIVESGSHEALLARRGLYARLFENEPNEAASERPAEAHSESIVKNTA